MPRHRLPEDQRRDAVTFRLPKYLIDWVTSKGNLGKVIEKILLEEFNRETKGK